MGGAGEITGIVAAPGQLGGDVRGRAQQPNLRPGPDCQAVARAKVTAGADWVLAA